MTTDRIETLLDEQRRFPPPDSFRAQAHVRDTTPYERVRRDREGYWADWAKQLEWSRPWDRVLEWKPPHAKWFLGGKLNASVNCLDRHVRAGRSGRVALIWEGEPPGEVRRITYGELHAEVNKFANVLKNLGIGRGDRVAIYLPMVPEVAVAMLACARIGAVHTVVFGGFSAESLRDRTLLRRIRPAGARCYGGDVRGRPRSSRQRPVLVDLREARRHRLLHGADGDPRVHEVGQRAAGTARSFQATAPRLGWRANQSGGMDVVSAEHRRRALSHRRHVVANGDRRHHDHAAARRDRHETRIGDRSVSRH